MPHTWHKNVPRKANPTGMPGAKYILSTKKDWALCSDHNTLHKDAYQGAHFTEGKAGAGRGEGFSSRDRTGRNLGGLLPGQVCWATAAVTLSQMYFKVLCIRKVNGTIMMWDTSKTYIQKTPCLHSVQSVRASTTHAKTLGMNDDGSLIARALV